MLAIALVRVLAIALVRVLAIALVRVLAIALVRVLAIALVRVRLRDCKLCLLSARSDLVLRNRFRFDECFTSKQRL
jgi:hypothetical protein